MLLIGNFFDGLSFVRTQVFFANYYSFYNFLSDGYFILQNIANAKFWVGDHRSVWSSSKKD